MATKLSAKKIQAMEEKIVADAYNETCKGIQIPILQTPMIMAVGRKAIAEGRDVKVAVKTYVDSIATK